MVREAKAILHKVFGYEGFRPLQEACVRAVLEKRDTLLIMPTGGGKSLCYQIPALLFPGLTVVVSPLISLMMDQVRQLRELGVEAALLNSNLPAQEYDDNVALVRTGSAKLLFLAPETLMKDETRYLLRSVVVDLFVIDEAHCISDWGHDFRPEYRALLKERVRFSGAACLAMTATATPRVRKDILASLGIKQGNELIASFNRPNLFYEVTPKTDGIRQTLDFLKRFPEESGIIYCFSRKQVDDLTGELQRRGYRARPYHAGLGSEERTKNQELFIRDDAQIIVATIAFGMGINKPNVRFVLHYNLPKNIESYYQETGRAGRDGLPAHCLLLFSYGDIHKIRFLIGRKTDEIEKQAATAHLNAMVNYAEAEHCRRGPLIRYFGEPYREAECGRCDNCAHPGKTAFDMTDFAEQKKPRKKKTKEGSRTADDGLFQLLRKKRKEIADKANLPSYIVFSDKSLVDMSARQPRSENEFAEIYGVGTKKLENYGGVFLKVIQEYCDSRS